MIPDVRLVPGGLGWSIGRLQGSFWDTALVVRRIGSRVATVVLSCTDRLVVAPGVLSPRLRLLTESSTCRANLWGMALSSTTREWEFLPVVVGAAAAGAAVGYVRLMEEQGDMPKAWFLASLVLAAILAFCGAIRKMPRRGQALAVSGSILVPLGVLGMFSIGLPILVAGVTALVAAARAGRSGDA